MADRKYLTPLLLLLLLAPACGRSGQERIVARVGPRAITLTRFMEYYRTQPAERSVEEEYRVMSQRLDELITYTLIEQGGRADGLQRTEAFRRARENHEKDMLNRLYKQRRIVEQIHVSEADVDTFLARSLKERHVLHMVTTSAEKAQRIQQQLESGADWKELAIAESDDPRRFVHGGDLGWLRWGQGSFPYYPDLEPIVYRIPVGAWDGPLRSGPEYHFVKITEERDRQLGSPELERANARGRIMALRQNDREQELVDRIWSEGGYRVDQDQFRWLVEKIGASFEQDPRNNPVPRLSPEDGRRVVVRSSRTPYTAQDLLDRLELVNTQARDNNLTLPDWQNQFIEWIITDEVAAEARRLGYERDPSIRSALERFTDSKLYADKLGALEASRGVPDNTFLERYYTEHPQEFDVPELRALTEALLATRAEAERILARARQGEDLADLAGEVTIREGFRERRGRMAPLARDDLAPLGEAASRVEEGQLGPVVETPLGFSVFRVDRVSPPNVVTFQEVRENLRERLRLEWRAAAIDSFVAEARRRWRVRRDDDLLRGYAAEVVANRAAGRTEPKNAPVDPPGE